MMWFDILERIAITCLIVSASISMVVAWGHGARQNMSLDDPALRNKISPIGKICFIIALILLLPAVVYALIVIFHTEVLM